MSPRLIITGSGGYIGSYITPGLIEDGFDVIQAKFIDGELIFKPQLEDNETVYIINLAAATKGSNNFTIGYQLSVVLTKKLFEAIKQKNIIVKKFIQFASFGELGYKQKLLETIFYKQFKKSIDAIDDYQFWKIKQREILSKYVPDRIANVVIPYITTNKNYNVDKEFSNMRLGRKILVTRLEDILVSVKYILNNNEIQAIVIPEYKRIKVKGSLRFIKNFIVKYFASFIAADKTVRKRLIYTVSSQSISVN